MVTKKNIYHYILYVIFALIFFCAIGLYSVSMTNAAAGSSIVPMLIRYGIEGVQYQINQKDMLERPNGYNDEKDGITTNFWWGRRDSYEKADSNYAWDDYNELKAEYNKIAIDYPWDRYRFMTTNINNTIEEVTKVCDKYIPEITYGRYEGTPEAEVNEFRTALKAAGVDEVKTYLQNIYDADKAKNGH